MLGTYHYPIQRIVLAKTLECCFKRVTLPIADKIKLITTTTKSIQTKEEIF